MRDQLLIMLAVRYNIPGVKCQDTREFVITPDILKRMLDGEQFDNNTTF
jgi:hypothetical protein